ncbi:hypothetical protein COCMIDRAFT_84600, partial [Bipolaris oryzae ATCC 44560]
KKKNIGVLLAEANMLRAIVPTSETIANGSIKYYVACHQTVGLCDTRLIAGDMIFYFSEIWDNISHNAQIKQSRTALGTACKYHASKTKKEAERVKVSMVDPDNRRLPNPLTVTRPVAESNAIFMQYCIWETTDDLKAAKAIRDTLIKLAPRLTKKPSNEGTIAFYDFTEPLKKEEADRLIQEVKVSILLASYLLPIVW